MAIRHAWIVVLFVAAACGQKAAPVPAGGGTAGGGGGAVDDDAPSGGFADPPAGDTPPPPDAATSTAAGACKADADHCCMPDGTLVRPGGCQPSYPDNVQPATQRAKDGTCLQIECHLKCLPEDARIATPHGDVRVRDLVPGDEVWTLDARGRRVAGHVYVTSSVPVIDHHEIVEITLDDGRTARASAAHPLASTSGIVGDLAPGARFDGATITGVRAIEYAGARTWDLLPDGATGAYWADGVLLGSTLRR
jgi:hypothetical protein